METLSRVLAAYVLYLVLVRRPTTTYVLALGGDEGETKAIKHAKKQEEEDRCSLIASSYCTGS